MKKIIFGLIIIVICILANGSSINKIKPKLNSAQRLYVAINKYAEQYNVPLYIAYNVACLETGYRGPFHDSYNHKQTSKAGAVGAMQIIPKYASHYAGFKISKAVLRDSIELNVEISMKMLNEWYKRYKRWDKATGAYNTGRPIINKYAKKAVIKNFYVKYWIYGDSIPNILVPIVDTIPQEEFGFTEK
jgi:soluble lytic murein transglycosylase-like protein